MASTLETTTGEPGVMMSCINQDSPSHQATISYCTLGLSNCCSIQTKPPLIQLSDLHEMQQVRASRQSQGRSHFLFPRFCQSFILLLLLSFSSSFLPLIGFRCFSGFLCAGFRYSFIWPPFLLYHSCG